MQYELVWVLFILAQGVSSFFLCIGNITIAVGQKNTWRNINSSASCIIDTQVYCSGIFSAHTEIVHIDEPHSSTYEGLLPTQLPLSTFLS